MEEVATPALAGAGDVRQLVDGARGEEQPSCCQAPASGESKREAALSFDHSIVDESDAVAAYFCAGDTQEVGGAHPVARQKAVHMRCRCGSVARRHR